MTARRDNRNGAGIGVDSRGLPVVDPTANVTALIEAAQQRQDDLREATEKYVAAEVAHVKEMALLREQHGKAIAQMESNRLNSIRQVDVLAVNTAADRAAAAIAAVAATTATNADNLRNTLTTTAQAIATQTANANAAIMERISALEKSSYMGVGRQTLADPQIANLLAEMQSLRDSRSVHAGTSQGVGLSAGVVVQLVASVGVIGGLIVLFMR